MGHFGRDPADIFGLFSCHWNSGSVQIPTHVNLVALDDATVRRTTPLDHPNPARSFCRRKGQTCDAYHRRKLSLAYSGTIGRGRWKCSAELFDTPEASFESGIFEHVLDANSRCLADRSGTTFAAGSTLERRSTSRFGRPNQRVPLQPWANARLRSRTLVKWKL
jgi:hypothetical protein